LTLKRAPLHHNLPIIINQFFTCLSPSLAQVLVCVCHKSIIIGVGEREGERGGKKGKRVCINLS
jgi:hypothetical protein